MILMVTIWAKVSRVCLNRAEDPDLPTAWLEYVAREEQRTLALGNDAPVPMTNNSHEAAVMPFEAAEDLAKRIGGHAVVCSRGEVATSPRFRVSGAQASRFVAPESAYESLERRGLA
jgi:hypothetical protein